MPERSFRTMSTFRCTWRPHHNPNRFTPPQDQRAQPDDWTQKASPLPPSVSWPYRVEKIGLPPLPMRTSALTSTTSHGSICGEVPGRPCVWCISAAGQSDQDRKRNPAQTWTLCSTKTPVNRPRSTSWKLTREPRPYSPDRMSVSCFARFFTAPDLSRVGQAICASLISAHLGSCFPFVMLPQFIVQGEERDLKRFCSLPKTL